MLRCGAVSDAKRISAPSSSKNADGERDPEMKQSREGEQWFFGMKAHIGVDARDRAWRKPCAVLQPAWLIRSSASRPASSPSWEHLFRVIKRQFGHLGFAITA